MDESYAQYFSNDIINIPDFNIDLVCDGSINKESMKNWLFKIPYISFKKIAVKVVNDINMENRTRKFKDYSYISIEKIRYISTMYEFDDIKFYLFPSAIDAFVKCGKLKHISIDILDKKSHDEMVGFIIDVIPENYYKIYAGRFYEEGNTMIYESVILNKIFKITINEKNVNYSKLEFTPTLE